MSDQDKAERLPDEALDAIHGAGHSDFGDDGILRTLGRTDLSRKDQDGKFIRAEMEET